MEKMTLNLQAEEELRHLASLIVKVIPEERRPSVDEMINVLRYRLDEILSKREGEKIA